MDAQNEIHEDTALTGVCIPLTDAVIDYLIDHMSTDQRTEALRVYMREMRNMNDKDAELFVISKDELGSVFRRVHSAWEENGQQTSFHYWRNSTEGIAMLGDMMFDLLEEKNPGLFGALWHGFADAGE